MPLLNYTTKIAVEKTVGEISRKLARAGAQAVMQEYNEDGSVESVCFRLHHNNQTISFRMPARIERIYVVLQNDPGVEPRYCSMEQAARVGWRIVKDWIEAQLALVESDMVEMVEVFLPYAQRSTGETLYEALESSDYQLLGYDGKA